MGQASAPYHSGIGAVEFFFLMQISVHKMKSFKTKIPIFCIPCVPTTYRLSKTMDLPIISKKFHTMDSLLYFELFTYSCIYLLTIYLLIKAVELYGP